MATVLVRHSSDGYGKLEAVKKGRRVMRQITHYYMGGSILRIRDSAGEAWEVIPNHKGYSDAGGRRPDFVTVG